MKSPKDIAKAAFMGGCFLCTLFRLAWLYDTSLCGVSQYLISHFLGFGETPQIEVCVLIRYDRIQELVNLCGKKKSFLSEAMGFSSRYLIDAKKQNTNIADEPLQILAKELKTTPEYLRGETDDPGIKGAPATEGEGSDEKISRFVRSASAEELDEIYRYIDFLESKRVKK